MFLVSCILFLLAIMNKSNNKNNKSAIILDGTAIAQQIKLELRREILKLDNPPGLAAILIGDNAASELYLKLKEKACHEVGIEFHKYLFGGRCFSDISQENIIGMIKFLNADPAITGIIVQLPLPPQYQTAKIIKAINPGKDVDGFSSGDSRIIPPTVAAISELLKAANENLAQRRALLIGNSDIFLKGLKKYLIGGLGLKNIRESKNIPKDSAAYDIIVIALGRAGVLKKAQVKPGSIVIDVGINRVRGKTVGDVDPKVAAAAGWLSPVPGGVGPLTVACLLRNVVRLAKR